MSENIETVTIKHYYGTDIAGFYWAGSPQKRGEAQSARRNTPAEFEATYQGRPGKRIGSIFRADDFTYYQPPERLGFGMVEPTVRAFVAKGHAIFQAWDTAFSTSDQSAHSVCITGMFVPCDRYHRNENPIIIGDCDQHFDVVILDVFRAKLDWGALPNEAKRLYHIWLPQLVLIEKRASGISLVQTLPQSNIPVEGIEVGAASKGERAVNRVDARAAGSVQGWCRQHRVLFPAEAPWLETFTDELKDFSGEGGSSSDQVDAFVHLVTHAIRMGSETMMLPSDDVLREAAEVNRSLEGVEDRPNGFFLQYLGGIDHDRHDPWAGTCGRCGNYKDSYCRVQQRSVIALDSCFEFVERESKTH